MSGPRLEGPREDHLEGAPGGEVAADSGWSTCAETGLGCEEQKLEAGDRGPRSDAESDAEVRHLPKPHLVQRLMVSTTAHGPGMRGVAAVMPQWRDH